MTFFYRKCNEEGASLPQMQSVMDTPQLIIIWLQIGDGVYVRKLRVTLGPTFLGQQLKRIDW